MESKEVDEKMAEIPNEYFAAIFTGKNLEKFNFVSQSFTITKFLIKFKLIRN